MSWHSGLKKPSFILIAILGALLGFNQIDATGMTKVDNNIGTAIAVAGAAGYLVEKKRDTKNKGQKESSLATRQELQTIVDDSWDVDMFHNNVVLPVAEKRSKEFTDRPWALQVFYSAQSKCRRVHNVKKWWYLYSLALDGFRAVWGMTWEEALKMVPEWRSKCQGYSVESHASYLGGVHYAIYRDVVNYQDDYGRTSAEPFVPFEANFEPEDYISAGALVAHTQG